MIKYSTWKFSLLTKVHSGLLVSKQFFQVKITYPLKYLAIVTDE